MEQDTFFKAMVVRETDDKQFTREITQRRVAELPEGDLLIEVHYSSLNYKDALSATGNKGVTRSYPHTPGIDAAGTVRSSEHPDFEPGDEVIVIGYDLGMNTPGGYGQYIRVPAAWAVRKPEGLSLRESMSYGTAGFTAALSVNELMQQGVQPEQGEILVTGATGGVGSFAVALLVKAGYPAVAATGKAEQSDWLTALGAQRVVGREEVDDPSGRPLLSSQWAGVVDTVGGNILATAIKTTKYGGVLTCCGNAASHELNTTVYPFILRGVRLIGIDSVQTPIRVRERIWHKLATDWKLAPLDQMVSERSLKELDEEIDRILQGGQVGRILVDLQA